MRSSGVSNSGGRAPGQYLGRRFVGILSLEEPGARARTSVAALCAHAPGPRSVAV